MFFCGVFDGHGPLGHKIARYARDTLPSKLHSAIKRSQISDASAGQNNFVNGSTDKDGNDGENFFFNSMKASLIKSFSETDDELSLDSAIDSFCSGTTAVTVIKKVILSAHPSFKNWASWAVQPVLLPSYPKKGAHLF